MKFQKNHILQELEGITQDFASPKLINLGNIFPESDFYKTYGINAKDFLQNIIEINILASHSKYNVVEKYFSKRCFQMFLKLNKLKNNSQSRAKFFGLEASILEIKTLFLNLEPANYVVTFNTIKNETSVFDHVNWGYFLYSFLSDFCMNQ